METKLLLNQFEQKIDLQLDQCYLKLSQDIKDLILFTMKDSNHSRKELRTTSEGDIEARIRSFQLLQPVVYHYLCKSYNVGDQTLEMSQKTKKVSRASKLSVHMPRLLAILGFDTEQLKMILKNNGFGQTLEANVNVLTDWFNDILNEEGYKWWPRCISTSAFAEILVIYLKNVKVIDNDETPVSKPEIKISPLNKNDNRQTKDGQDVNTNILPEHISMGSCDEDFTSLIDANHAANRLKFDKHIISMLTRVNHSLRRDAHEVKVLSTEMANKYKRYLIIQNMAQLDFTCRFGTCATVSTSEKDRLEHEKTAHNWIWPTLTDCDKFLCKFGKNFIEQIKLIETADELYQCYRCKTLFESNTRLSKHLKRLHVSAGKYAIAIIDSMLSQIFK